jgi:hypothetical protein
VNHRIFERKLHSRVSPGSTPLWVSVPIFSSLRFVFSIYWKSYLEMDTECFEWALFACKERLLFRITLNLGKTLFFNSLKAKGNTREKKSIESYLRKCNWIVVVSFSSVIMFFLILWFPFWPFLLHSSLLS